MFRASADQQASPGVRVQKREATRARISEAALGLFLADGYQATTVDAIAEAAGISRRSFFSYFESKDDILAFWQAANWAEARQAVLQSSPSAHPLHAVRDVMVRYVSRYSTEEMAQIDALLRSSASLMARKQAFYAEQEAALFSALCEVWREPERRMALRMVAMASIGALRLAIQTYHETGTSRRSLARTLRDAFVSLEEEVTRAASAGPRQQRKRRPATTAR